MLFCTFHTFFKEENILIIKKVIIRARHLSAREEKNRIE